MGGRSSLKTFRSVASGGSWDARAASMDCRDDSKPRLLETLPPTTPSSDCSPSFMPGSRRADSFVSRPRSEGCCCWRPSTWSNASRKRRRAKQREAGGTGKRVAPQVRIDDYSSSLVSESSVTEHMNMTSEATSRALECLKFTAVAWMSEKGSQRIENAVLCRSDYSSKDGYMTLSALLNYSSIADAPISISAMQSRTLGPRAPAKLLPDSTSDDVALYGK